MVWWGHPITTGDGDVMDYFMSVDEGETKDGQEHYEEQMIRFDVTNIAPFNSSVQV